ncbi:transglycosylase SLT domain-containing protein [Roseomonas sp. E05]|uniref:transglycosylase SLT domain-containing protein n=1 Tax=Roseomonas sp. E05 TaxID=3046310 RepID=UPI0024B9593C|nr:transglycosylase SLT domain-containing protein [Roseomonas sp. E05]MDJ0390407.1 transglycosylase SLT domain-containing protein [Roseomonas sp. E05]
MSFAAYAGLLARGLVSVLLLWSGDSQARAAPPAPAPAENGCLRATLLTERQAGLPRGLLLGIALVESGRGGQPNAVVLRGRDGRSHWGDAAWRQVRQGGLKHAHLGCMQLSVFWHGDQFPNHGAMLDPARNVAYAGAYLQQLRARAGSWRKAVLHYYGGQPAASAAYLCRVHAALVALGAPAAALLQRRRCAELPTIEDTLRQQFRMSLSGAGQDGRRPGKSRLGSQAPHEELP